MGEEPPERGRETTTAHVGRVAVKEKAVGSWEGLTPVELPRGRRWKLP